VKGVIRMSETVESKSKKLGWTCLIRDGWEVKIVTEEFEQRLAALDNDEDKIELIRSLDNMTELHQGQKVLVMGIMVLRHGDAAELLFQHPARGEPRLGLAAEGGRGRAGVLGDLVSDQ